MRKEELEHLNYLINKLKTREKELTKDKGSFISSEVYNITTNDGHHIRREKLLKGGKDGSAVIIVPFVDNDKVILCVEPRVFTKRTVGIGFPAGYECQNRRSRNDNGAEEVHGKIGFSAKSKDKAD